MITFAVRSNTSLLLITLLVSAVVINACNNPETNKNNTKSKEAAEVKPSFKAVWGRGYTEVRRNFSNGISFSDYGYQLEPEWRLSFPSDDSVNIFNPKRKMFVNAPMMYDHDSIFNIAWSWMRLRKLTKDSIVFQVMKVENRELLRDKSIVYMTLYANDYIKNVLHTTPAEFIRPNQKDTVYIKKMVAQANADTSKSFSARQQVVLKSKTPLASIQRVNDSEETKSESAISSDYLLPEYNITINKAYEDFSYGFTVRVDEKGIIHYERSINFIMPEYLEATNKTIRAIVDGYLKAYITVTPGKTLGMPHSSIIILHVKGKKK
jgi:hypothetical protein